MTEAEVLDTDDELLTIVSTVQTIDGPKPAVIATHRLFGERLIKLFTIIENVAFFETPEEFAEEVLDSYEDFLNSPADIVAAANQTEGEE